MNCGMKKSSLLFVSTLLLALFGCVSAERIAEYETWKASDDGIENVEFADFEAGYKEGWRDRAAVKKAVRLTKEEAKRKERERIEAECRAKEEAEFKERTAKIEEEERNAKEKADRIAKESLASARRTRDEELRKEEERVEAELVAAKGLIFDEYRRRINAYWDSEARESYRTALIGRYEDLSRFVEIGENDASALIEAFAEEKLPNATSAYEKSKERAMELQQIYNEEFPVPEKSGSDKYAVYCTLLEQLAKARTTYVRAYQELAHYYFNYKFGVLTQDELLEIDEQPILIPFFDSESEELPICKDIEGRESAFCAKYLPDSYAIYQQYRKEFAEIIRILTEASSERVAANVSRGPVFIAAFNKAVGLRDHINQMTSEYVDLYMKHRLGEMNSEELAQIDLRRATQEKSFAEKLPTVIRKDTEVADSLLINAIRSDKRNELTNGQNLKEIERRYACVVREIEEKKNKAFREIDEVKNKALQEIESDRVIREVLYTMVVIPNRDFRMQKTEVTQRQWKAVMGNNPSRFKGDDLPVECVSWDDCQEFIKRLDQKAQESGQKVHYRLPTEEDWEYCCLAGSKGEWGRRANGQEGPLDVMGWYNGNSGGKTHPVAQKEPNAWGLYDMHGNVEEWTSTAQGRYHKHVLLGGSWYEIDWRCRAHDRFWLGGDAYRIDNLGFRLVAEDL